MNHIHRCHVPFIAMGFNNHSSAPPSSALQKLPRSMGIPNPWGVWAHSKARGRRWALRAHPAIPKSHRVTEWLGRDLKDHGGGVGIRWSLRSRPTQTSLGFYTVLPTPQPTGVLGQFFSSPWVFGCVVPCRHTQINPSTTLEHLPELSISAGTTQSASPPLQNLPKAQEPTAPREKGKSSSFLNS